MYNLGMVKVSEVPKIISIASLKGGVGKSTTAIHLAAYLASRRGSGKVVCCDGDRNATILKWADRSVEPLPFLVCDGASLPNDYHWLVVDSPGNATSDDLLNLAARSDALVIPSTCSPFSLEQLLSTLAALPDLLTVGYSVLLNAVPDRRSSRGQRARAAITAAGLPLLKAQISKRTIYEDAELQGCPVWHLSRGKVAYKEWEVLGKELIKQV